MGGAEFHLQTLNWQCHFSDLSIILAGLVMAFFFSLFCSQLDDIFVCINFFVFVFLFLNGSQVGTAVVTRSDGKLALGRLGALCEQVSLSLKPSHIDPFQLPTVWFSFFG
jgi:hypothetical protein